MADEQIAADVAPPEGDIVTGPNEMESVTNFIAAHPVMTLGGLVLLFTGYMLMRSRIPIPVVAPAAAAQNPRGRRRKFRRY